MVDAHDGWRAVALQCFASLALLAVTGCAMPPKQMSVAEAEWRHGCKVRHRHVVVEDSELLC